MEHRKQEPAAIYTVCEAARRLRRCEATVRKLADSGRLPAIRTQSGRRLFDGAALDAFRDGELRRG